MTLKSFAPSMPCIEHLQMTVVQFSPSHKNLTKLEKTVCDHWLIYKQLSLCMCIIDGICFKLSTHANVLAIPPDLYSVIFHHLQVHQPDVELHSYLAIALSQMSIPLLNQATFFDQVILNNKWYLALSWLSQGPANSLVAVCPSASQVWVGELCNIFIINQPKLDIHHFGQVQWFAPFKHNLTGIIWAAL